MNSQKDDKPIDNDLFKMYTQYKLCKIEKSNDFKEAEKAAMISILKSFQFVDGNTVRSIMNEAFKHAATESAPPPIDKKTDKAREEGTSTKNKVNVIDLTLEAESNNSNDSSPEPPQPKSAQRVSISSEDTKDDDSDYEPGELKPNKDSRKRKREDASYKDDEVESKGNERNEQGDMKGILSKEAFVRLGNIVRHAEESKRTLQERMKTVDQSFEIHMPRPDDASTFGSSELFKINRYFNRKSRLTQSQEHLAAYKIGKLIERDRKLFSDDIVHRNLKRYYQGLMKQLKFYSHSEQQDFVYFAIYCRRVVRLVEKIGLFAIFIPEIVPPYRIKITEPGDFSKIENYLSQHCACFKNIAHYNQDGTLKMEDIKDDHADTMGQSSKSTSYP